MHVPAVVEEPGGAIALDHRRAEHLGEQAEPSAAPEVELPQPVAGGVEPLHAEDVVQGRGVHVRNAPAVDQDLGRAFEAGQFVLRVGGHATHPFDDEMPCLSRRQEAPRSPGSAYSGCSVFHWSNGFAAFHLSTNSLIVSKTTPSWLEMCCRSRSSMSMR